jgi:signal peptidase I
LRALPGETVTIKDGAVVINGEKMMPSAEIAWLQYESGVVPGYGISKFVVADKPHQLDEDEYCVLGDISINSLDSRYFGTVKRDAIKAVVTVCYWPPSRWRIWR